MHFKSFIKQLNKFLPAYNFASDTIKKFANSLKPDTLFPTHWFDERSMININLHLIAKTMKNKATTLNINKLTRYSWLYYHFS